MKQKKKNVFKIGILAFGISLLLWNCSQEEFTTETSEEQLTAQKAPYDFNASKINKELNLGKGNFQVDWDSHAPLNFDKSVMITTKREFDAFLNEEDSNPLSLMVSKINYKLIVTDTPAEPIFEILRFETFKTSQNQTPSYINTKNYDGMMFVLNYRR